MLERSLRLLQLLKVLALMVITVHHMRPSAMIALKASTVQMDSKLNALLALTAQGNPLPLRCALLASTANQQKERSGLKSVQLAATALNPLQIPL